ncbi:MAG: aminotransferase class IV [Verrucomicrobiota bacterium]
MTTTPTERTVWVNGNLCLESEAPVSPFDHGLLTGDGCFETMITYGGKTFALRRHWERLQQSAGVFGIPLFDEETWESAIAEVVAANKIEKGRVRVTVTGGPAPLGSEKGESAPTYVVAAADLPEIPARARIITVPFRRNDQGALVNLKTTSYGENVVALTYAKKHGGTEAIFGNTRGLLCEGTGTNVFLVHGGKLITPTIASGCLPGVTRALVLELCAAEGIRVEEKDVPLEALETAPEAFLTSTLREVQPIETVNGKTLATVEGETTRRLKKAFTRLTEENINP